MFKKWIDLLLTLKPLRIIRRRPGNIYQRVWFQNSNIFFQESSEMYRNSYNLQINLFLFERFQEILMLLEKFFYYLQTF